VRRPVTARLSLGRWWGVPVTVTPAWLPGFVLGTLLAARLLDRHGSGSGPLLPVAAAGLIGLFLSVVLHEVGHAAAARAFGATVLAVHVGLASCTTTIAWARRRPVPQTLTAAAGPGVNVLLAALGAVVLARLPGATPTAAAAQDVVRGVVAANVALAGYNLLPGLPLDGGQVLGGVLTPLLRSPVRAELAAARVGQLLAVAIAGLAVGLGWTQGLLPGLAVAVAAVLLGAGATAEIRRATLGAALEGRRLGDLARPALVVDPATPATALDPAAGPWLVGTQPAEGPPQVTGWLGPDDVRQAARTPGVLCGALAHPVAGGAWLDRAAPAESLLERLGDTPASSFVVTGPGKPGPAPGTHPAAPAGPGLLVVADLLRRPSRRARGPHL
jgi:Zn-dependent protease